MINPQHLTELVIRPVLERLSMHSDAAEILLLGTAIQESRLTHLKQLGNGPALGIYQMEPDTHDDIWRNYLRYKGALFDLVESYQVASMGKHKNLVGNLYYATAMTRVHYRRVKEPLPHVDDLRGQAEYWKAHYNTPKGKGTVSEYIDNFNEVMK